MTEKELNQFNMGELPKHTNSLPIKVDNKVKPYKNVNAIIVPDNPTNGDVIKAMFPNVHVTDEFRLMKPLGTILYLSISRFQEMRVQEDWWNAPYKGVE